MTILEALEAAQARAKAAHLGIWEYGDPYESDDEPERTKTRGRSH